MHLALVVLDANTNVVTEPLNLKQNQLGAEPSFIDAFKSKN